MQMSTSLLMPFALVAAGNGQRYTPLTGLNVLDVGCGGGLLTEPLARLGAEVIQHALAAAHSIALVR